MKRTIATIAALTARVGRRALARGTYRATLVATDAADNRSKPARVRFRVAQVARAARA